MPGVLHRWRFWHRRREAETSRLVVGSTGSGKSEGMLVDLIRLADRGDYAIVLLDGHGALARKAAGHWALKGHERRLVFDALDSTDRVLAWPMLEGSVSPDESRRRLENAETREDIAQCFLAQRNLISLAEKPLTKEWLDAAIDLCLAQPQCEPLSSLLDCFRVGSSACERLLTSARDDNVIGKFRELERLKRRSAVQFEALTGAARRLLEPVCTSEVIRLRCRAGGFDWSEAIRDKRLIAIDGGGLRARETKRAAFLLISLQVIQAARRHFAKTRLPLPVVLVLEEAGALGLVTPFLLTALQELRKAGLAVVLLTQSSLDFGDSSLFEAVLANAPTAVWYRSLTPADQELGAKVMSNPTFDPLRLHFTRVRAVASGATRAGAGVTRYRKVIDAYYQPPALQEQLYRTRLSTLRVGERLVRDPSGVSRQRVRMLRPPRSLRALFDEYAAAVVARVREQAIYLPPPAATQPTPRPDGRGAAERLRGRQPAELAP